MFLQKRVSTVTGLVIIFAFTIFSFGGAFSYKYYAEPIVDANLQIALNTVQKKLSTKVSGLKTYRNNEYGFEFQYPVNLTKEEKLGLMSFSRGQTLSNGTKYNDPVILFFSGKNDDQEIARTINPDSHVGIDITESKQTINGLTWNIQETQSIPQEGIGTFSSNLMFYTQKNGYSYIFQCVDCKSNTNFSEEDQSTFNQMISTFKFTK